MNWICEKCGERVTKANYLLLDERYADGFCELCKRRVTLIRVDIFDRKKWQAKQAAMAEAEALRKAIKNPVVHKGPR